MRLTDIETLTNRARNHYRLNRDPGHPSIESAEARINTQAPAVVLSQAVRAGFLAHPAGTAHFYILLDPRRA
jgi:hypothetical protein